VAQDLFLQTTLEYFHRQKKLAEQAMAQVNDEQFFRQLDPESNSIAMLVKHMAGNLRSRWTDFLHTDGEKPSRNRDSEFLNEVEDTRQSLLQRWETGWQCLFDSLQRLNSEDLGKTVTIVSERHTAMQAIQRGLTHAAQHTGQIIFLAKHFAGARWRTLSIPRGKSREFSP
jgi:hypothetical protein